MSGLKTMFKGLFSPEDEFEEEEYDEMENELEPVRNNIPQTPHQNVNMTTSNIPKIVSLGQSQKMEILNFTMQSYSVTGEVSEYIKNKKPIIVNMEQLDSHESQRALDYLSGACQALNGHVEKVTENIFIFAPEHVNVNPDKVKKRSVFPPTV